MSIRKTITSIIVIWLLSISTAAFAFSPYAAELVSYSSDLTGSSLYNDPSAVLGQAATKFANGSMSSIRRTKLVEPAWYKGPSGEKLITTINAGQYVEVKFDHQVMDDPLNPYGIDFLVFGNSFFVGSGSVSDSTNMNTYTLTGGIFAENMKISVSQDGTDWYTYDDGPYGDSIFPTNAYLWDSDNACWTDTESDYTKPVDPSLTASDFAGKTAAEAIALYDGSAGGTGFDLAESGLDWIQYIKVEGVSGFSGGEIDGFSDVAAVPEPGSMLALTCGLIGMSGFILRRRK
ncbi:PEP-CTERM sorting domain-containing protein [bacterium]|nr:PEP-CTERM sorting domain-containing protein [bacterium]